MRRYLIHHVDNIGHSFYRNSVLKCWEQPLRHGLDSEFWHSEESVLEVIKECIGENYKSLTIYPVVL